MKQLLVILFLLSSMFYFSQNTDSLKVVANNTKIDKLERVKAYFELSNLEDENLMELNCNKALSILSSIDSTNVNLKEYYNLKGSILGNLGYYYRAKGIVKKAFSKYYNALVYAEKTGNRNLFADMKNNIGMLYYSQKQYKESIPFYLKAIDEYKKLHLYEYEARTYMNLAGAYQHINKFQFAIYNFKKALNMFIEQKDTFYVGFACNNIAVCFREYNMLDSCFKYLNISLPLFEKLKLEDELAWTYDILGGIYTNDKKFSHAEEYCTKCLIIADKKNLPNQLSSCAYNLYLINKQRGDFKKALRYYCKADSIQDSLINNDTKVLLAKNEMEYAFNKKEEALTIESSKKSVRFEEEQKRSKIIISSIITILAVSLFFGYMVFKSLNMEKRSKQTILLQKDIIEEKQKEILDSINYAKRIQFSLLASENLLNQNLPEHFVLFKPKDVVSGDFYWGTPTNEGFVYITSDCTGHGVPGAFMSLLNISKLSQAINENKITRPDLILNNIRAEIIKALNSESSEESKDGMDAVLCKLDLKNMKLQYAAANNSFYIIRKNELLICNADKMPVGKGHDDSIPFTFNEIALEKEMLSTRLRMAMPTSLEGLKARNSNTNN